MGIPATGNKCLGILLSSSSVVTGYNRVPILPANITATYSDGGGGDNDGEICVAIGTDVLFMLLVGFVCSTW